MFSKTVFVFLAANFLSDFSYGQNNEPFFRKDYKYIASQESFYKVHTTPHTFADAKQMCALEGASLFYAEDEGEANAVISFWVDKHPGILWVFVGLSDIQNEGFFETVDGRPISDVYSSWQIFQPDNHCGNEDCVHLNILGYLNDYRCDSTAHFICKKRLERKSLERNYHCGMANSDYTPNKDTGKCYKLHSTPLNWAEAYDVCRTEDAMLAAISNHMEADALVNMTKSTTTLRINSKYQRGIYHLGFHYIFSHGWYTVKGAPLNVDADLWFDSYQPEKTMNENCGAMFFNGRLINTDCYVMETLFICERNAEVINPCNEEDYY